MKTYKVVRSSGYLAVEDCGHDHKTKEEANQCLQEILQTSEHKNWFVSAPFRPYGKRRYRAEDERRS